MKWRVDRRPKRLVAVLRASFEDTIERGFSCPSEASEPRRREDVAELGVGGQRAQRGTVTRQRIARADEDGGSRKDPAKRVEVVLCRCAGHRLDQHDRPIGCERFASAPGSANRIVHVVQAVEESNQIVSSDRGWIRAGASDLEAYPVGPTRRARRHFVSGPRCVSRPESPPETTRSRPPGWGARPRARAAGYNDHWPGRTTAFRWPPG